MRTLILILLSFLLIGCGATKITRAERKIDKAVNLIGPTAAVGYIYSKYNVPNMSVIRTDTVFREETRYVRDTISLKDTLWRERVIEKNGATVLVRRVRDSIFVEGRCRDTIIYIYKHVDATQTQVSYYEKAKSLKKDDFFRRIGLSFFWGVILGLVIFAIYYALRKIDKLKIF
ncbi:MAG: hypothetical protein QXS19_09845 [Candidatus Methanomethylicia archaeon]